MEYIFEDFIAGFLQTYFSGDWKIEYQKSNLNLTTKPAAFQMQHDIFLTFRKNTDIKIIVDTKYKMRDANYKLDKKKGISQIDLYQMTSYAFRRGCNNVLILYPNVENEHTEVDEFEIQSGFNPSNKIKVTAAEVPFWSNGELKSLSYTLKARIAEILKVYLLAEQPLVKK